MLSGWLGYLKTKESGGLHWCDDVSNNKIILIFGHTHTILSALMYSQRKDVSGREGPQKKKKKFASSLKLKPILQKKVHMYKFTEKEKKDHTTLSWFFFLVSFLIIIPCCREMPFWDYSNLHLHFSFIFPFLLRLLGKHNKDHNNILVHNIPIFSIVSTRKRSAYLWIHMRTRPAKKNQHNRNVTLLSFRNWVRENKPILSTFSPKITKVTAPLFFCVLTPKMLIQYSLYYYLAIHSMRQCYVCAPQCIMVHVKRE